MVATDQLQTPPREVVVRSEQATAGPKSARQWSRAARSGRWCYGPLLAVAFLLLLTLA
jgi:hypothetical protein